MLALFTHMQGHLGELKEKCIQCNLRLSSKEALVSHMKVSHAEKPPICSICEVDFPNKEMLFDHMNKHRKYKPFSCTHCETKVSTMESLRKHLKTNHDVKNVKELGNVCNICNLYFYTKDHLLLHRVNQGHDNAQDEFVCKVCQFSCTSSGLFKNHLWEHTQEQR